MAVAFAEARLDWLGYATFRWETAAGTTIYSDPGRYGVLTGAWAESYGGRPHPSGDAVAPQDGDIVLVTHDHHYDDDGIRRVAAEDATIVVHESVDATRVREHGRDVAPLAALPFTVEQIAVDEQRAYGDVAVRAIPAYNHPDGPNVRSDGTPIHPQGMGCGFVVDADGHRWCWTGDSDRLDVHDTLRVDVLVPSISHTITMDRHDAAALAASIDPALVVPIHYNTFPGLSADSRAFATDVTSAGVPVALDERGLLA